MATGDEPENLDLKSRISELLTKKSTTDVKFYVGSTGQMHECHKIILAAGSQVFEAMFYGKIPESSTVDVPDVTPNGFDIMLRYLYSDEINIKNEFEAFAAAYAAKKYLIPSLYHGCEQFLLHNYRPSDDSVIQVYEQASFFDMHRVKQRCLWYISRNTKCMLQSQSFRTASKSTVDDIMKLDLMDVDSEVEVVEALWSWGKEQCKENNVECSSENIMLYTGDLVKHIRFMAMSFEEMEEVFQNFEMFDTEEKLSLELSFVSLTRSISNCERLKMPTEFEYDGQISIYTLKKEELNVRITVRNHQLTILGLVVAFKPIPFYAVHHRTLHLNVHVKNLSTKFASSASICLRAEDNAEKVQDLILDDYVIIDEGETGVFTIYMDREGIRLGCVTIDRFVTSFGKATVDLEFGAENSTRLEFPVTEVICM